MYQTNSLGFLDSPRTYATEFPLLDYKKNKLESPPASSSIESDQWEVVCIVVYTETIGDM